MENGGRKVLPEPKSHEVLIFALMRESRDFSRVEVSNLRYRI